ncbi:hypothetical protein [uncultured Methanobrevibacter sp.]|uniref:hypothetical protein n=1 Tax=uncultured Methanobrevibacter sp. TaxID=253161 RepID=UPI0025E16E8C|nr:hypothetical protein [uncultured Methanobrevibacter sp.]
MKKMYIIGIILAIVIIATIGFSAFTNNHAPKGDLKIIDASALTEKGTLKLNGETKDENSGIFSSTASDENAVLVNKTSILKLTKSFINKTGNTATSGDDADFYGVNSAVLVKDASKLTIEDCEIETNAKGSNGIFVTNTDNGQAAPGGNSPEGNGGSPPEKPPEELKKTDQSNNDTTANIKNVKITTHQDKSRGLDSTFGGIINAENVVINTDGNSCAALATDRGEGNVTVINSVLNTGVNNASGRGSPLIYSTGNITVKNTQGTAYVSQIACIEGKNSITLENSQLTGFGEGNRKDGDKYVDLAGVFIYQSMSGDADVGTSTFISKNSKLSVDSSSKYYSEIPMFYITNTKANIFLESSTLDFGSGVLFKISGQNQWGNTGSNGGDANLTCTNQEMKGNILVDAISSLNITLKNSKFEGAINSTGTTGVVVESGSTWTLNGDSNVTSLSNSGKIDLNGHKLFVNGQEYKG